MKTTSDCIGIREYLLRRRLQPHHETATHGMFLSPLREERTPSFSVRYDKGLWYDFGLGEGGTLLQLVMRLEGCSMAEAIRSLRRAEPLSVHGERCRLPDFLHVEVSHVRPPTPR